MTGRDLEPLRYDNAHLGYGKTGERVGQVLHRPHGSRRRDLTASLVHYRAIREKQTMIEIRKTITLRETVLSELGVEASRPITRAVGMAVIRNPFAGQFVEDLKPLFYAGAKLDDRPMPGFGNL